MSYRIGYAIWRELMFSTIYSEVKELLTLHLKMGHVSQFL